MSGVEGERLTGHNKRSHSRPIKTPVASSAAAHSASLRQWQRGAGGKGGENEGGGANPLASFPPATAKELAGLLSEVSHFYKFYIKFYKNLHILNGLSRQAANPLCMKNPH